MKHRWILALGCLLAAGALPASIAVQTSDADFLTGSGDGNVDIGPGDGSVRLAKLAGSLGAWTSAGNLPMALANMASWRQADKIWIAGGWSGSATTSTVQSLQLGVSGTVSTVSWNSSLPKGLMVTRAVRWASWLYLGIGHDGISAQNKVYRAQLAADGSPGAWTQVATLPSGVSDDGVGMLALDYGRLVYVAARPAAATGSVLTYSAPLQPDGSLGAWSAEDGRDESNHGFTLACAMGAILTLGGETSSPVGVSTVDRVAFSAAGALGAWALGTAMPAGRGYGSGNEVAWAGKVYQVGGKSYSGGNTYFGDVYSSVLAAGGVPGAWSTENSLGGPLVGQGIIAAQGGLYSIGGSPDGSTPGSGIYRAALNPGSANSAQGVYVNRFDLGSDQALGELQADLLPGTPAGAVQVQARTAPDGGIFSGWSALSSFPLSLTTTGRIVEYRILFSDPGSGVDSGVSEVRLSGPIAPTPTLTPRYSDGSQDSEDEFTWDACGDGHIDVTPAGLKLQKLATGVGVFTSAGTLPQGRAQSFPMCWATRDALYAASWDGSSGACEVYSALFSSPSTLGPWVRQSDIPAPLQRAGATIWKGQVYLGGGVLNGTTASTKIYHARLLPNGGLGAWSSLDLPSGDFWPDLAAIQGRLFAVRNYTSTYQSGVWAADFKADGSLMPWVTPAPASRVVACTTGGWVATGQSLVYLGGSGAGGTGWTKEVQRASIDANATLSAWTIDRFMPQVQGLLGLNELDTHGCIIQVGGQGVGVNAERAVLDANGLPGADVDWEIEANRLPLTVVQGEVVEAKDHLWYLGGQRYNPSPYNVNTIYVADLALGSANAAKGFYYGQFDLPTDQVVGELTWTANLPAYVRGQVRWAGADGVFGAWSARQFSPLPIEQSVRYVQYSLEFSDPGAGQDLTVSDVTLRANFETPTLTSTISPTPSASPTPAPPTPTWAGTPTLTATPTAFSTFVPPPSSTRTPTPSATPSVSPTVTQSGTAVPGPSVLPTDEGFDEEEGSARSFPNPSRGGRTHFMLTMGGPGNVRLRVLNAGGQLSSDVQDHCVSGKELLSVNTKDYAPGVYLYQIEIDYDNGRKVLGPLKRFAIIP